MDRTAQRLARTVTFVGAFAGFLAGVVAGLVVYGDRLLLPLLPAALLTIAGAVLAPAIHRVLTAAPQPRERTAIDEQRWERRMAAHRAMAELGSPQARG